MPAGPRESLCSCLIGETGFVALRFHRKTTRSFIVEKDRVEDSSIRHREGSGGCLLHQGSLGFAAYGSFDPDQALGDPLGGATISPIAFQELYAGVAVSGEFRWDLWAGGCHKSQLAKVDAGGPHVRCKVLLGGEP